jgi:hypothetical protein
MGKRTVNYLLERPHLLGSWPPTPTRCDIFSIHEGRSAPDSQIVGRVDRLGAVGGESGILLGRRSQRPNFGDVLLFWKHMSNLSGHVL